MVVVHKHDALASAVERRLDRSLESKAFRHESNDGAVKVDVITTAITSKWLWAFFVLPYVKYCLPCWWGWVHGPKIARVTTSACVRQTEQGTKPLK